MRESAFPKLEENMKFCYFVMLLSLYMPLRLILFAIHNKLASRDYTYGIDDYLVIAITLCIAYWILFYFVFKDADLEGSEEGFSVPGTFGHSVLFAVKAELTNEYPTIPFIALTSLLMWIRFLSMLSLTRIFGPMLRIIVAMFGDVVKFLFVFSVVLIILASVAALMFGELE